MKKEVVCSLIFIFLFFLFYPSSFYSDKSSDLATETVECLREAYPTAQEIKVEAQDYRPLIPYVKVQTIVINPDNSYMMGCGDIDYSTGLPRVSSSSTYEGFGNIPREVDFSQGGSLPVMGGELKVKPNVASVEYSVPPTPKVHISPATKNDSTSMVYYYDYSSPLPSPPPGINLPGRLSITPIESRPSLPKVLDFRELKEMDFARVQKEKMRGYSKEQFHNGLMNEWYNYGHRINSNYDSFVLTYYSLYQFEGFRQYVWSLPSFSGFVFHMDDLLWNRRRDSKRLREKRFKRLPGLGKWGFQKLITEWKECLLRRSAEVAAIERRNAEAERKIVEEKEKKRKAEEEAWNEQKEKNRKWEEESLKRQEEWINEEAERLKTQEKSNIEFKEKQELYRNLIENDYDEIDAFPDLQEIRDCANYFRQVKENCAENSLESRLANLGEDFANIAEMKFEDGSREEFDIYKNRIVTIFKTLTSDSGVYSQSYELNNYAKFYLPEYEIDLTHNIPFQGDSTQHNIHSELIQILNDTSRVHYAFSDNFHINNISTVICRTSQAADEHNRKKEYEQAYSLSDFCYHTFQVCKKTSLALLKGSPKGVGQGVGNFSKSSKENLEFLAECIFEHPTDTATNMLASIGNAIKNAALSLGKSLLLFVTDGPEFYRQQMEIADKISGATNRITWQIVDQAKNKSAEDLVADSVAFLTENLLSGITFSAVATKAGQFLRVAKEIGQIAKAEMTLAGGLVLQSEKVKNIITPVKSIFEKAGRLTKNACKYNCPRVQKAVMVVETIIEDNVNAIERFEKGIEKFKNTKGFSENVIKKINDAAKDLTKIQRGGIGNVKGVLYEVEVALQLEAEGGEVLEFGRKIGLHGKRDFDIITKTKAVECKDWTWAFKTERDMRRLKSDLGELRKITETELNKSFEFYSKQVIPQGLKDWFKISGVLYKEG